MLKSALPYEIFGRTLILRRCTRSHFGVDTLKRGPTALANILDELVAIPRRRFRRRSQGCARLTRSMSFPTGRQLELFCYRLERLTCLGTDPCQSKGTIFPSKGEIVAFSLPGRVILGGDGALDEEGE
jgi:hypothetical protein